MKYARVGNLSVPLHEVKIVEDGKTIATFKQNGILCTQEFSDEMLIRVAPSDVDNLSPQSEEVYVTGVGQTITHVHDPANCEGQGCAIHHPSNHPMATLPTLWRDDRGLMERVCEHGVGHPDPDHIAWVRRNRGWDVADAELVHGCDGCCKGAYE